MCFGDSFLKFAHMGKPHERFFRLKRDLKVSLGGSRGDDIRACVLRPCTLIIKSVESSLPTPPPILTSLLQPPCDSLCSSQSVFWSGSKTGKKAKFVSLLDVAEVRTMDDLPEDDTVNIKGVKIRSTFAVAAADRLTDTGSFNPRTSSLGFSLVDREGERLLNLIAPNANLLELWLFGFKCILTELPVLYPDEITVSGRNLLSNSQKASIRFRRGSR